MLDANTADTVPTAALIVVVSSCPSEVGWGVDQLEEALMLLLPRVLSVVSEERGRETEVGGEPKVEVSAAVACVFHVWLCIGWM